MSRSRVIHSDDLPWEEGGQGDLFAYRRRRLGRAAHGRGLGCSLMELDPGKTALPFHYHCANEEAIVVLAGEGTLRLGAERVRVVAGDYVALPPGPEAAHQLTNTGTQVLRYLVVSTMIAPDVCVYPDSSKVAVVDALPDEGGQRRRAASFPLTAEVGYWHGETTSLGPTAQARSDTPPLGPEARRQQVDQMVEADLEALRRKVAAQGREPRPRREPSASKPEPAVNEPEPGPDDLDALKQLLDD